MAAEAKDWREGEILPFEPATPAGQKMAPATLLLIDAAGSDIVCKTFHPTDRGARIQASLTSCVAEPYTILFHGLRIARMCLILLIPVPLWWPGGSGEADRRRRLNAGTCEDFANPGEICDGLQRDLLDGVRLHRAAAGGVWAFSYAVGGRIRGPEAGVRIPVALRTHSRRQGRDSGSALCLRGTAGSHPHRNRGRAGYTAYALRHLRRV